MRTSLPFLFTLFILSTFAQEEHKPTQPFFKVESDLARMCDSLHVYAVRSNKEGMEKFYTLTSTYDLADASLQDSMGYFLSRGLCEYLTDRLDKSVESLLEAQSIARRENNLFYAGIVGNHLGNAYYLLKDNESALRLYNEVVANDSAPLGSRSSVFNNISVVNMEIHQVSTDPDEKDSLEVVISQNFKKAVRLQKETGDLRNLAGTYSVMIPWFARLGQTDSALAYVDKCRKLSGELGLVGRIAFLQIKQGALLTEEGKYDAAIDTLQLAVNFYESQENTDQVIHALAFQANAYKGKGDYKRSSEIYDRMYRLTQESFTKQRANAVSEYETKYKTQEKEIENQKLEAENKAKQLYLNRLILGLLAALGVILAGVFYHRNRMKKKQLELKTQEVKLKNEMIKSNLDSEEKERKRIARELHDGVGQQITSIKLGLENIGENQAKTESSISELRDMVTEVLQSVRGISHQMMPVALQRFGLIRAIESLVEYLDSYGTINYRFEHFNIDELNISEATSINLYRIVQELTTNINKHSRATKASVQCYKQGESFFLSISDNGIGLKENEQSAGIGMLNVQSRVSALGAKLIINSVPGDTNILIKLELKD